MTEENKETTPHIGTLAERSLHAGLKTWLAEPGDQFEVRVERFVIDIVRDKQLLEIQTRHLYAMKRKLAKLLPTHTIHLFHPIARDKWIVRETENGEFVSRRKSPKRGRIEDIFAELVRVAHWLEEPNFTLTVLLTQEEQLLRDDGKGSWRRRYWSVADRRLLDVVDEWTAEVPADLLQLLPDSLPTPFTNKELASTLRCPSRLAGQITYTLRKLNLLSIAGKKGNANLFLRNL